MDQLTEEEFLNSEILATSSTEYTPASTPKSIIDNSPFRKKGKNCLFLGDLSAFCTEDILEKEFAQFGTLTHLRIARSKTHSKSLLFGFLEYEETDSAINAMNALNRKLICGRAIK